MDQAKIKSVMRWAIAAFYLVAGILHLVHPEPFLSILPRFVAWPRGIIAFTGLCEIAGSVGLLYPRTRMLAGIGLAAYAVCVFPANIKHSLDTASNVGWWYHAPRLALQPVLVWWALYCSGVAHWPFALQPAAASPLSAKPLC